MPGLSPVTGPLGIARARHLLRRLTFGPTQSQTDTFAGLTIAAALGQLFDHWQMPAPPVSPAGKAWVETPPDEEEDDGDYQHWLKLWWMGQMYQDSSSFEKLTFFLHTILTTKQSVVENSRALYFQQALFRQYLINDFTNTQPVFNRYSQLLKKICADNAMLRFLNGEQNEIGRPNENFARELLELFTIGKGESMGPGNYSNYTETDIKEIAKALTGWGFDKDFAFIDPDTKIPSGKVKVAGTKAHRHDNTNKQLSAALSSTAFPNPVITPNSSLLGSNGEATEASVQDELNQVIDIIFAKEQTARYLCRRIYRFFVHYHITDAVENEIIGPLATTFIAAGYRLRPVLAQLFSSEHFFEAGAGTNDDKFGALIKSPLEITLGTMRYFRVALPTIGSQAFYDQMDVVLKAVEEMGLPLLEPYDVAGYEPYHQAPAYNRNWITTNTLANRYNFIRKLLDEKNNWGFSVNVLDWASSAESGITDALATTPAQVEGKDYAMPLVQHITGRFLPLPSPNAEITPERMNYFAVFHLGGFSFDYWQEAWGYRADTAKGMLRSLLNAALQSPEYQLF